MKGRKAAVMSEPEKDLNVSLPETLLARLHAYVGQAKGRGRATMKGIVGAAIDDYLKKQESPKKRSA
jgi:hypothetical protein